MRVFVVGFGTVGRWLVRALHDDRDELRRRYGLSFDVVALATRRDGFVHRAAGLDVAAALELAGAGRPLHELPGVERWPTALEGLRATTADVLVEVTASPAATGEPGLSHIRAALERGIAVVTSNKWPVALDGVALCELARARSTMLRAESTVLSGTPLLRALTDGLAGARPVALRGVLNATANFILTEVARGSSYADALAEAQRLELAEREPSADVDGHDAVAKTMILAALVLGRQLRVDDVARRGISAITADEIRRAAADGRTIREVAGVGPASAGGDALTARVEPLALAADDPLARVDGTDNAVVCRAEPLGDVTVIGPGAGPRLAGQGVLSDLIDVALRART